MSSLSVQDLGVRIGRKTILEDIGFSAAAGQLTAVVGPNGSGKSTLLKALTGELHATGHAQLGDVDIRRARPEVLADMRAVLPQSTPMAFPFQVLEVVRLGLRYRDLGSDEAVLSAIEKVGLQGYEARFYQELSGGEQQRAQLARVLCQVWSPHPSETPRWLFLDEPVSSLDIAHQLQVMQIARDFADAGGGVLAVMHDLNLSAMFADRVLVMRGGQLAAAGGVQETLQDALLSDVYGCTIQSCQAPAAGSWYILPHRSKSLAH
ncbi:MAG: heme ABC transporter ATP-binding protein [Pseudomonadota bacterium]